MAQYNDSGQGYTNASNYSDLDQFYSFRPPIQQCQSTVRRAECDRKYYNENRRFNANVNSNPYRSDYDNLSGTSNMKVNRCDGEQMYQVRNPLQYDSEINRARMRISNTYPHSMVSGYNSGYFNLDNAYETR
jgi:hypothetical protein